ncbi:MAG: helix-turn-helix domain-containing protein [Planctomycetes bacterium]|nr:helix-turn-helix domain-containing protein [Planctomycetota bacterium]MBI3845132.1 helix-turn-helix domain-containing protein [Planctomycetota bacterium]
MIERPRVHLLGAEGAAAVLHPLRRRILEGLNEPDSASGLSKRLGLARQKINYHLRELEREGLLELVEERKKGNCVERLVRATARAFVLNPAALGALGADPEQIEDRFSSAYLVAVASQAIHDVAVLRERAAKADKKLATFTMQTEVRFASAEERRAFTEELANVVAKLAARYHDEKAPGGRRFRFVVGGYPALASERRSSTGKENH